MSHSRTVYIQYPKIREKKLKEERNVLTVFTTGGRRDADIATPTKHPAFPPSTERATPAPDGKAMSTPIHRERGLPLKPNQT